jgi:hypothetical protein
MLSDTKPFVSFVEYILCYHAWCHYSHQLPRVDQVCVKDGSAVL